MSYEYGLTFGSGDPRNFTGLSPTFVVFKRRDGTVETPPAITEIPGTGLYPFVYTPSPTFTIYFICDGGSSITDSSSRYLNGTLDPIASVDRNLGFLADGVGTTVLPTTAFAFAQRAVAYWESDSTFSKSTGLWNQYAKGTSTLLVAKTLANSSSQVVKT